MENQNTKDIRYVDEKLDHFKSEIHKSINDQSQKTAELTGEVKVLERQLHDSTDRLERKIDSVQSDLNENINKMTAAIATIASEHQSLSKAIARIDETLAELKNTDSRITAHEVRIAQLEKKQKNQEQYELELKKENKKGMFGIITGIVAGIFSLLGIALGLLK